MSQGKLREAQDKLIEADIKTQEAYVNLVEVMKDKSIPLVDRHNVIDNKKISEYFKLVELESIFDEDEIREIEAWNFN